MINQKQIFRKAAEIIRRDGWTTGKFGSTNEMIHTPRCVLGAMYCAARSLDIPEDEVDRECVPTIRKAVGLRQYGSVSEWNDALVAGMASAETEVQEGTQIVLKVLDDLGKEES